MGVGTMPCRDHLDVGEATASSHLTECRTSESGCRDLTVVLGRLRSNHPTELPIYNGKSNGAHGSEDESHYLNLGDHNTSESDFSTISEDSFAGSVDKSPPINVVIPRLKNLGQTASLVETYSIRTKTGGRCDTNIMTRARDFFTELQHIINDVSDVGPSSSGRPAVSTQHHDFEWNELEAMFSYSSSSESATDDESHYMSHQEGHNRKNRSGRALHMTSRRRQSVDPCDQQARLDRGPMRTSRVTDVVFDIPEGNCVRHLLGRCFTGGKSIRRNLPKGQCQMGDSDPEKPEQCLYCQQQLSAYWNKKVLPYQRAAAPQLKAPSTTIYYKPLFASAPQPSKRNSTPKQQS